MLVVREALMCVCLVVEGPSHMRLVASLFGGQVPIVVHRRRSGVRA